MSVTFTAEVSFDVAPLGFVASCFNYGGPDYASAVMASRQDALNLHASDHAGYDGCDCHGESDTFYAWPDNGPTVNVANGNAFRILRALGYAPAEDLCGSDDAEAFYRAVVRALAASSEYYVVERLAELAAVASYAIRKGVRVTWA